MSTLNTDYVRDKSIGKGFGTSLSLPVNEQSVFRCKKSPTGKESCVLQIVGLRNIYFWGLVLARACGNPFLIDNSARLISQTPPGKANMEKMMPLGFEDLQLGNRWTSEERVVLEEDIQQFADLTGDQDPLHTDPVFAANGPFGKPIAHGLLGISFLAGLSSQAPAVQTSAFVSIRSWSFSKPVYAGDRVHVVTEVLDLKPHGRRHGEVHWYRQLINQHGHKVQEGILITLVSRRVPLSLQRSRIEELNRTEKVEVEVASPESISI